MNNCRPAYKRLQLIHLIISSNTYPGVSEISQKLEVSRRTILRDIEFLRDQMGVPILYDTFKKGYYYENTVHIFSPLALTGEEAECILKAKNITLKHIGEKHQKHCETAFDKIICNLNTGTLNPEK